MPQIQGFRGKHGGTTAVEFALVLPVFFMLFYGILTYGLIFLLRLGLQHSAEDAARAALRHQVVVYPASSTRAQERQLQLQQRVAWARAVAAQQASWMNGWAVPEVRTNVCLSSVDCTPTAALGTYPDCNESTSCQIVVSLHYDYATHPVIPTVPGMGVLAPSRLEGRSRALIEGRAL